MTRPRPTRDLFRWSMPLALVMLMLAYCVGSSTRLEATSKLYLENDDLDLAVAESASGQQQFTSATSHEILASGWPATSPMWPSIEMDAPLPTPQATTTDIASDRQPVEPFIYADKPSKQDYSLLLTLNKTLIEMLTKQQQQAKGSASNPLTVSLSFEYYLNHETKVAAMPGIKIEVDRKEFDYLEPAAVGGAGGSGNSDKKPIKIRMWTRHSRQIALADAQHLDKPDWLKLSLVNRESPSLVAIRRLRVEFSIVDSAQQQQPPPSQPQAPPASTPDQSDAGVNPPPASSSTPSSRDAPPSSAAQTQAPPAASDAVVPPTGPEVPAAAAPEEPVAPQVPGAPAPAPGGEAAGEQIDPSQGGGADQGPTAPEAADQVPAASDVIASTIKPVSPKQRKGWLPKILGGRRRRKRQAAAVSDGASAVRAEAAAAANATSSMPLVLTCAQSDACEHWKAEPTAGQIQWSLGRMPPSIGAITRGYYYVSNRLNYGDSSRLLLLWLNQTDSATIVDQAADHCVDLALYVTERTRLKLYKAVRQNETSTSDTATINNQWKKSALLVTWAPTSISEPQSGGGGSSERAHLAGAQLAATNQSGWTLETLCYGDFFERHLKCGLGECALAFEMSLHSGGDGASDDEGQQSDPSLLLADSLSQAPGNEIEPAAYAGLGTGENAVTPTQEHSQPEQVVGVALLKQYAVSVPNRQARPPRWLETWQRNEIEPIDNWRLYPRADFDVRGDSVGLASLYTGAHYSLQSDWLQLAGSHLDFGASLLIELTGDEQQNQTATSGGGGDKPQPRDGSTTSNDRVFSLRVKRRIVAQQNYQTIYALNSTIDWYEHYNNATKLALFNLSLPNLSELIPEHLNQVNEQPLGSLFKMIIDIVLDCHWLTAQHTEAAAQKQVSGETQQPLFKLMLANVSLADRCHPSPCQFGICQQNGTELEDWQCACDAQHRGRRCEFGRWCQLAHVAPPVQQPTSGSGNGPSSSSLANNLQLQQPPKKVKIDNNFQLVILKSTQPPDKQAAGVQQSNKPAQNNNKAATGESVTRVTGKEFCQRKLGAGSKCTEIDLPLNDRLYFDENETFTCSCQDDYYLSDDSKCRQAHQCNSIVCPSIGQICDETKPFNRTQPCHCNEKQDWYPAPIELGTSTTTADKCIRRQCHDKRRDCGFDAHVCLPTLPGERPICKCGPKFTLKQHDKTGQKYCQSTACVLPTLNDCQHLCTPNDTDLQRPYTCSCHEGYTLDKDGRTCKATMARQKSSSQAGPHCKPPCNKRTQVCTELGCKCKQGYVPEGEIVVQVSASQAGAAARNGSSGGLVNYVQSVRCLNVCSLSYAENKAEFERIESVCPLGLCEPSTFNCRCSDPNSSALVHTKYEPIWANETTTTDEVSGVTETGKEEEESDDASQSEKETTDKRRRRASPLCHLKRVCQPDSASYQLCRARGAICVPDYTKAAMFDCICPPSSEKRSIGQAGDFNCEPRCSAIRQECLKKQAVCRPIDKDQVRCDCLPGMMLDRHDQRCYLAHYSYAMNIIIVNKYYEPESRFHKLVTNETSVSNEHSHKAESGGGGGATSPDHASDQAHHAELGNEALHKIVPQFQRSGSQSPLRQSMFILDYNQCNLTQLLPKSIIDDPYEHDMGTFLQYMDQCNEKIHQNARTYNLNSRLAEDLRQSMRQHLRDFTVTTNNSLCQEMPATVVSPDTLHNQISYLNCTVYLQSMEPVEEAIINHVFTNCDKHGADERFCWIKPRLLLMKKLPLPVVASAQNSIDEGTKQDSTITPVNMTNPFQFRQIIACEVNKFCGDDAHSSRLDERTSLCSCKCPPDIEMIDLKELEPRSRALIPFIPTSLPLGGATSATSPAQQPPPPHVWLPSASGGGNGQLLRGPAIKEICAPRNHCGANSTYCSFKTGSVCQYDIRTGSRCNCVYPSYENNEGRCIEITFSQLDSTLIVIIIMVGTCLIVSIVLNLYALAKSKHGLFGSHKEYPLNEFTSSTPSPVGRGGGGGRSTVNISHRHPDDDDDDDADAVSVSNRRHFTGNHNSNNRRNHHSSGMGNRSTGVPNMAFDPND